MPEAQFTTAGAEMKIDMGNSDQAASVGLTKEEVIKFANDPFWMTLRRTLFALFWILWIAMLTGSIVIIVFTPKCAKPKEPYWYETSPIYTIRVDKYADSNGDGIGDLAGIISRLSYIQNEIHINAITLDGLLDKNDPATIRAGLGSFEDFKKLASQIKVIVKVPLGEVVNELDTSRELDTALSRWLDEGAAGFVLDEFNSDLPVHNEGLSRWHNLITNRSLPRENEEDDENSAILLALSTQNFESLPNTYCRQVQMVFNYDMIKLTETFNSAELHPLLAELAEKNRTSCRDNFVLGTGEVKPLTDRFELRSRAEAMLIFNMLADATPVIYYGDEYGKKDTSGEPKSRELKIMPESNTGKMDWEDLENAKRHPEKNQFKLFQQLTKLRLHEASIRTGTTAIRDLDSFVLAMARIKQGNPGFLIVSNFRAEATTVNLRTSVSRQIPDYGSIVLTSTNSDRTKESRLNLEELQLNGEETLVLQFVPEALNDAAGH